MKVVNVVRSSLLMAILLAICSVVSSAADLNLMTVSYLVGVMLVSHIGARSILHGARIKPYSLRSLDRKRVLAIGSEDENKHALALLWQTHFGLGRQKQLGIDAAVSADAVKLIRKKVRKHGIDEVVFCAKDLAWGRIIDLMEGLKRTGVMFKIAQPAREFIIGPSSIESLQDLDIMELHAVNSAAGRRTKRMIDVTITSLLLLTLPISVLFVNDRGGFVSNAWSVLLGRKSWVGYQPGGERALKLPGIKPGVLGTLAHEVVTDQAVVARANAAYAKDYSPWRDLSLVVRGFHALGRA